LTTVRRPRSTMPASQQPQFTQGRRTGLYF
jgi:hypothetical protein